MSQSFDPNAPQQEPVPQQAPAPQAPSYAAAPAPTAPPTNTLALVGMISSIAGIFTMGILCVLGVILGHIGLNQIKRTGEGGRGLGVTALVVGYIGIAGWIIALILIFIIFGALIIGGASSANLEYSY